MAPLVGRGYSDIEAWESRQPYSAPAVAFHGVDPRRSEKGEAVRSILSRAEHHIASAAAIGWIPRALPRIYLVGTMRAVAPGGADFLPRGRKTRGLLACLCLEQGERVSRSRLVGLLWDRSADAQARMSLRQSLSELNSAVNRHVPGLVEIGRDSVRIDVGKCDIANGRVLTQCRRRHRRQEFLGFLKHIEANVPGNLDVHLVIDNYATHKHPTVRNWLSARPRYHVHHTPTYASWLNQVERWFALLTQRQIRRGFFRQRQGTHCQNRGLRTRLQRQGSALRVDRHQ